MWLGPLAASKAASPPAPQHPAVFTQDLGPAKTHMGICERESFISSQAEEGGRRSKGKTKHSGRRGEWEEADETEEWDYTVALDSREGGGGGGEENENVKRGGREEEAG